MNKKIYGTLFYAVAILAALWLYPQHPLLCGVALGLFAVAFLLQGTAVFIHRCKNRGQR